MLSIARIILIFPIVYLLKINSHFGNKLLVVFGIIIILTDYFDGFFARKLDQSTELGKFLDPLADKIAMGALLVTLILYRDFPISLVVFLLYRDFLILLFGWIVTKKKGVPASNWWGRVNTAVVSFAGLLFVMGCNNFLFTIFYLGSYFTIFISGVSYYILGEKILFEKKWHKYLTRVLSVVLSIVILNFILSIDFTSPPKFSRFEEEFPGKDQLILQYAPVLYFVEDEPFFPIDVQSFLDHSKFMKSSPFIIFDKEIEGGGTPSQKMSKYNDEKYYLKLDRGIFDRIKDKYDGIKSKYRETAYSRAFKVYADEQPVYILQYWFFYWVSKSGKTNLTWHECDWEMVMYYLDANFKPIKAGYSQHHYGEVKKWEEVEKENSHPVVYVARGSHGCYFKEGQYTAYYDNSKKIPLWWDLCAGNIRWVPAEYTLKVFNSTLEWVNFKGYWGIPITSKLHGPKYRNPKNKKLSMWNNPIGWFKKYERL